MSGRASVGPHSGRELRPGSKAPKANYTLDPETGCWEWKGRLSNGYGQVYYNGQNTGAHRAYFAHYVGVIPAGKLVRHRCDNPCCVNPAHLELGDARSNGWDKAVRGRAARLAGATNGKSILSEEGVRAAFELRDLGWTQRRIADALGVSQANVCQILGGQRRKVDAPSEVA